MKTLTLLLALGVLTSCATAARDAAHPVQAGWREIATEDDRRRLRDWRTAWVEALRKASAAGKGAEVTKEGALLQPDAALAWEAPPPGDYACRTIKIGAKTEGLLDYIAYPGFTCRIEQRSDGLRFTKTTGSQRPIGRLFPASGPTGERMIFLGTLQLGDEQRAFAYGQDRERDVAGVLDRIGERRWRLALPYPHFESTIDVIELIPRS